MVGFLLARLGGAVLAGLLVTAVLLLQAPAAHAVTRCSIKSTSISARRAATVLRRTR